eukprot:20793-Heterococcus_DN1.PRE.4
MFSATTGLLPSAEVAAELILAEAQPLVYDALGLDPSPAHTYTSDQPHYGHTPEEIDEFSKFLSFLLESSKFLSFLPESQFEPASALGLDLVDELSTAPLAPLPDHDGCALLEVDVSHPQKRKLQLPEENGSSSKRQYIVDHDQVLDDLPVSLSNYQQQLPNLVTTTQSLSPREVAAINSARMALIAQLVKTGVIIQLIGERHGFFRQIDGMTVLQLKRLIEKYTALQHKKYQHVPGLQATIMTGVTGVNINELLTVNIDLSKVTLTVEDCTDQQVVLTIYKEADIVYDNATGNITIQLKTTKENYMQLATAIRDCVKVDKKIKEGVIAFEIHFEGVGVVKYEAPFIWRSHAKCKNLDKPAHKAEKAAKASATAAGADEAVAKAAGAIAFNTVFIPLATWKLGPASVSE